MASKLLRFLTLLIFCSLSASAVAQIARDTTFAPTTIGRYEDRATQPAQSVSDNVASRVRQTLSQAANQGGLIPTTAVDVAEVAQRVRYQLAQNSLILPPPNPAVSSGSLSLARPTTVQSLPEATFASPLSSRPILSTLEPLPAPILPLRPALSNPTPIVSLPCATGSCGTCNSCQSCMQCWTRTCNNPGCGGLCCCDPCRPRFWARTEALLWWMEGYSTPPLLTSSPAGTPSNVAGVLGEPATQTLFGGNIIGDELRIGGRISAGYWFDKCRRFGAQAEFFGLGNDDSGNRSYGPDDGILTRPFFNTDTGAQAAQLINFPGVASGTMDFATSSHVYSASPSLRWNLLCCSDPCNQTISNRIDAILGYRYFEVNEAFSAAETVMPEGGFWIPGTTYILEDRIRTSNQFHGFEMGGNWMWQRDRWTWELQPTIAVGEVRRRVELDGSTRTLVPGLADETNAGGFLVRGQDIGTYVDREYAILPQVRANLGYCLGCNWKFNVGYNFVFLNNVFRPSTFIDPTFAGSNLGHAPPIGVLGNQVRNRRDSDVFLHGLSLGLTYNF